MNTNYNIPQNKYNNSRNYQNYVNYPYNNIYYQNDDRFFGGFLGPFVLGGVGGYLLGSNNNYNNYPQGPIPVFIPNQQPTYYPPYSTTNNIYY